MKRPGQAVILCKKERYQQHYFRAQKKYTLYIETRRMLELL